jgi:hypothetical protein
LCIFRKKPQLWALVGSSGSVDALDEKALVWKVRLYISLNRKVGYIFLGLNVVGGAIALLAIIVGAVAATATLGP